MVVIKRIARWVLFLASLAFVIPFPSDAREPVELEHIIVGIVMVLLALDMFLLILGVPRKRGWLLVEFGLYPAFVLLMLFRLISGKAVASLTSRELSSLGLSAPLLLWFIAIVGLLFVSASIVLVDAATSYRAKNRTDSN